MRIRVVHCALTARVKSDVNVNAINMVPKVRLHTAINRADFVSWCTLYTKEGNIREKMTLCFPE